MVLSIGENVSRSFEFAKDGLVGHWVRWILLIIITAIPIVNFISYGYLVKIYKGGNAAPELEGYGELFIDGLKLVIIGIGYAIIPLLFIIAALFLGFGASAIIGVLLFLIGVAVAIILYLFALIGFVRFAKKGSIGEAFNFGAIFAKIQEIGLVHYLLSYIVIVVVVGLISWIVSAISYGDDGTSSLLSMIVNLLLLILMPLFLMWQGKFFENLYSRA